MELDCSKCGDVMTLEDASRGGTDWSCDECGIRLSTSSITSKEVDGVQGHEHIPWPPDELVEYIPECPACGSGIPFKMVTLVSDDAACSCPKAHCETAFNVELPDDILEVIEKSR